MLKTERGRSRGVPLHIPTDVLRAHSFMSPLDMLCLLIAANTSRDYIVVEALAGCGKTTLLTGFVQRLDDPKSVLLLSFTTAAVKVVECRLRNRPAAGGPSVNRGAASIHSQTFDSMFYHAVNYVFGKQSSESTYQDYRSLAETITCEGLSDFVCKASVRYHLENIKFILVDEVQDSPPESLQLLNVLRDMGKTIILTGDRLQAILSFMQTRNLFEAIPRNQITYHRLFQTYRLCPEMVAYVNKKFNVGMVSGARGESEVKTLVIQARQNATLARIYFHVLFATRLRLSLKLAAGDAEQKFQAYVLAEVKQRYRLDDEAAEEMLLNRMALVGNSPPGALRIVFSTVFTYKGDEADVSVLASDVTDPGRLSEGKTLEQVREDDVKVEYVATTRPRFAIAELGTLRAHGNEEALREFERKLAPRVETGQQTVSSVCNSPLFLMRACISRVPEFAGWWAEIGRVWERVRGAQHRPMFASRSCLERASAEGSIVEALLLWWVEAAAYNAEARVPMQNASPELRSRIANDRLYKRARDMGLVSAEEDRVIRRRLAAAKLRVMLTRYLLVTGEWSLWSTHVWEAAACKARLVQFAMRCTMTALLPPLEAEHRPRRGEVVAALSRFVDTPRESSLLHHPEQWAHVVTQAAVKTGAIQMKGTLDLLIVDRSGRKCLVEIKAVRSLSNVHVLQAVLYACLLKYNMQCPVDQCVLINVSTGDTLSLGGDVGMGELCDDVDVRTLNTISRSKLISHFGGREYTAEELGGIKAGGW